MLITLDDVRYTTTTKPDSGEFGKLTNRMKKAEPQDVSKFELLNHIAAGKSFIGGAFSNGLKTLDSWQLAALDFDNCDNDGKPLLPDERGFLSPFEALERCESLGLSPMVIYKTLSYTKENPRYRVVFNFSETTSDAGIAQAVILTLLDLFPEADQACKNPNRIFLGSNGIVWATCEKWFE